MEWLTLSFGRTGHHIKRGRVGLTILIHLKYFGSDSMITDKIQDTDDVFAGFAAACAAAGPTGCAIAETGSTAASIIQWTHDLMDASYDWHQAGGQWGSSYVRSKFYQTLTRIILTLLLDLIFHAMYSPTQWVDLANQLYKLADAMYNGNTSKKRALERSIMDTAPGPFGLPRKVKRQSDETTYDYAFQAITCADAMDSGNTTTVDIFNEIIYGAQTVSQMCESFLYFLRTMC